MISKPPLLALLVLTMLFSCVKQEVDLIVHNATIYTVDEQFSIAEAMAISGNRIVDIGPEHEVLNKYAAKKTIDAEKKAVFPGFIDAHCHFYGYGLSLQKVNLTGTSSFQEVISRLIAFHTAHPDQWITGRGWDQNDWEDKHFPNKTLLDSLFPDVPVFVKRIDGHAALANQVALTEAGITPTTRIEGGIIEIQHGELSGLLIDNAVDLLNAVVPKPNRIQMRNALIAAQKNCLAAGLTTVDDAGLEKEVIDLIDDMHQKGELIIKVYAMANPSKENLDYFLKNGPLLHERLTVRSFKVYVDGAFGSRGALLLQPYSDGEAHHHGLLLNEKKIIQDLAEQAYDADFQLCAHAIGDSANRLMLDIYGEQLRGVNDKRWRIEHAQLLNPMDFKRFKEYTIIPSVQPTHATSDMYWAADRIGAERVKYAYAYRTLLDQNKMVALGTDFPVEEIYPLHTFYAAVTRKDGKGYPEKGYAPAHVLSRREALKGMTIWAAISNFEETEKGSLEKGKVADFVILDHDIMKIDEKRIRSTKVKYTAINGSIVYQSGTN